MIRVLPLLLLAACVRDAAVPYVGDCAVYPEGTFEYGQLGIGTCLAGPVALEWLSDGHTLAVSNADPFADFTGGSVLLLDMEQLDEGSGRNLVTSLASGALDLPMFNADMERIAGTDRLAVTNRLSDGARTREATDSLWFVDASDPTNPVLDVTLAPEGGALGVGYDPNTVVQDPETGLLFVINRTSHEVAMVDVSAAPAELVSAGGPSRLLPDGFVDADASGSRAAFVTLEVDEPEYLEAQRWALSWNVGTIRAWVPGVSGARRVMGNGEALWEEAPNGRDLDVTETDLVSEVVDPAYGWGYDGDGRAVGRMVFMDAGYVRDAQAYNNVTWAFGDTVLLGPDETLGESVIGGPQLLAQDGVWYLFYDGGTGSRQSILLATSLDGATFDRTAVALTPPDGVSYEDPHIVADPWSDRWRMWFTRVEGDEWSIGEAYSDDLVTWTEVPGAYTTASGAASPTVGYWGGRFHLLFVRNEFPQYAWEATSVDGTHWGTAKRAFPIDLLPGDPRPGLAIDPLPEDTFGIDDADGTPYGTIEPGELIRNGDNGWNLRLAAGMWIDPEDFGDVAAGGIQVDSVVEADDGSALLFLTLRDQEGDYRIGRAQLDGGVVSVTLDPVLDAGAGGGFDAEGVLAPVVTRVGDGFVMFYAGVADGLTSIGRATSDDGLTWFADPSPVLSPELEFEAAGVEPGSVVVGNDGVARLFYTAFDGGQWRIGEAEGPIDGGALTRLPGVEADWSFDVGAPGDWHDEGVARPSVLVEGDLERMWFEGFDGEVRRIGYAERGTDGEWAVAVDPEDAPRPVLSGGGAASFGVDGVARPVVTAGVDGRADGYTVWYAGIDAEQTRVGRAVAQEPDRLWPDQRLPSLTDTWGFTVVPESEEQVAIPLDGVADSTAYSGRGCSGMVTDSLRGFLYVTCKDTRTLFVVDVRDDSDGDFQDLNYLRVESIVPYESSSLSVGMRGGVLDPTRPWLWGLTRGPEALVAIDLSGIVDDAESEILEGAVAAVLPLPRRERDAGVDTDANVGPGGIALHPDGRHLFVTNFDQNSVSCFDLSVGAPATLVAEASDVGENPYALTVSPDGTRLVVGNYLGEVEGGAASSTLVVLDADPASPTFMDPITWVVNK